MIFVVIEDLTKKAGEGGRFHLYLWQDLKPPPKPSAGPGTAPALESRSWSYVKRVYR